MGLIKRLRSVTKSYLRTDTPIVGSVSTDTSQTVKKNKRVRSSPLTGRACSQSSWLSFPAPCPGESFFQISDWPDKRRTLQYWNWRQFSLTSGLNTSYKDIFWCPAIGPDLSRILCPPAYWFDGLTADREYLDTKTVEPLRYICTALVRQKGARWIFWSKRGKSPTQIPTQHLKRKRGIQLPSQLNTSFNLPFMVPRDRIELPTRGFSVAFLWKLKIE